MKTLLVLLVTLFTISPFAKLDACSIMTPDTADVKAQMINGLAMEINLPANQIPSYALTEPELTFLQPIGADCSGLDTGFYSAGYYFEKSYPNMTCTHRGVVIMKGFQLNGDIIVNDNTGCVGIPVSTHPIDGGWKNQSLWTTGLTRLEIYNGATEVQAFRKCMSNDCDMGTHMLQQVNGDTYESMFIYGNYDVTITIKVLSNTQLKVTLLEKKLNGNGYKKKTATFKRN